MCGCASHHVGVVVALAALGLCLTPAAASAVSFTGPTNYTTGQPSRSVAVGDFNGDSDPDLAVAKASPGSQGVSILTGSAGGTFASAGSITTGGDPRFIATGEFNGDSDPDLVLVRNGANDVSILLGAAGATFTGPANFSTGGLGPISLAIGEFNGDSDPDLAVANAGSDDIAILLGATGGTFTAPTIHVAGNVPTSIAVGDFNGDFDPDLAVANSSDANVMTFVGAAGGTFTGPTATYAGNGGPVAAGDFNGDSDPDLVVANTAGRFLVVLLGAAGAAFDAQPGFTCTCRPTSFAITDMNGDSDPELAMSDSDSPGQVWILVGAAGGTFAGLTSFPVASINSSVAVADFDGDLDRDLVTANTFGDGVSVLLAVPSTVSISNDISAAEGNSGTTAFTYTVSLVARSTDPVSVDYDAVDGTATAPSDFIPASGTLSFSQGETSKQVTVHVRGDPTFEPAEDFQVVLSNPAFTTIVDGTATGTIQNDDQAGYARPAGASPIRASLVVAYSKCNAPNRVHGAPLDSQSCNPPMPLSQYLTVGTPDANGEVAKAVGAVRYGVITGAPGTPADEADIALTVDMSDVRGKFTLGDYIAELWATVPVRLTDKAADQQTVSDFQFGFAVPCTPTADTTIGATCSVSTTADAVLPGAVVEGKRAIWRLGQMQVQDGGDDGEGATTADNTPFLKQGIFVP
jgi:hypothetical protein